VYFGLLLDKSKVGVAESEKRVAAIFLLPVWLLEPPGRSFLPYSGLHCRRIVHGRLELLSIKSARNGPKCSEIDRNSKNACRSRRGQT